MIVNPSVVSDQAYAPFGEVYDKVIANIGVPAQMFTGDTQDTLGGVFDTPNRELNAGQGRWLSPDPAGLAAVDPTNPQSWNRYGYVGNNPLALIDPSGTCSQITYLTTTITTGKSTYSYNTAQNVQWLYDGPCINPCPGQGYFFINNTLVCGPPANLGIIQSQLERQVFPNGSGGTDVKPLTPRQLCTGAAQNQLDNTTAEIDSRRPWLAATGGATFGFLTGAAWFCTANPAQTALCAETDGAAALPAAGWAAYRGGMSATAMWALKNAGEQAAAQNAYNQQVQNVCNKLPD